MHKGVQARQPYKERTTRRRQRDSKPGTECAAAAGPWPCTRVASNRRRRRTFGFFPPAAAVAAASLEREVLSLPSLPPSPLKPGARGFCAPAA